jgi:hypothetical protein
MIYFVTSNKGKFERKVFSKFRDEKHRLYEIQADTLRRSRFWHKGRL